jgi:DNA polymerase elongation subunit (family B)
MAAMGQIALTTANVFEEFYNDNKKVVYDRDEIDRVKIPYEGAFCGAVPGRYSWTVCDDFASLYPSQIRTCNFSFENFIQKTEPSNIPGFRDVKIPWTEEELEKFRQDKNYFVSNQGHVYKNDKDYAFKKLQKRLKQNRDFYKYTGQKVDSELIPEIEKLITKKKQIA